MLPKDNLIKLNAVIKFVLKCTVNIHKLVYLWISCVDHVVLSFLNEAINYFFHK